MNVDAASFAEISLTVIFESGKAELICIINYSSTVPILMRIALQYMFCQHNDRLCQIMYHTNEIISLPREYSDCILIFDRLSCNAFFFFFILVISAVKNKLHETWIF